MNGYDLTRCWYNFKFDNPKKVKSVHSDLFFYIIDLWNRLGQKKEFGLPTSVTMESLGIGSYNTFKKTLDDLFDFGFIKLVSDSKNQHQSKVIAISKIDKATDKALDKATIKASDKATDTILLTNVNKNKEQINNEQYILKNILKSDWKIFVEDGQISIEEIIDFFKNQNEEKRKKVAPKKEKDIIQRQLDLRESLIPFEVEYGPGLIESFFMYWSEPNASKTKIRKEMQPTWELSRRLATWFKNSNKNQHGKQVTDNQSKQPYVFNREQAYASLLGKTSGGLSQD